MEIVSLAVRSMLVGLILSAPAGAQLGRASSNSSAGVGAVAKNSWRGITPLRSSAAEVAQAVGTDDRQTDAAVAGPFKVEGGEVTFSFLTPKLAEIYRAPRSMVGKVFAVYFQPGERMVRGDLRLAPGFKQCAEEANKSSYYLVSDAGLAYQIQRGTDLVERIIYQPSRAEIRRLAVNTECVF